MTDDRFQVTNALRHSRPVYKISSELLAQICADESSYILRTSGVLQTKNCADLVCDITKEAAPKMRLHSALKSATAAFARRGGR